MHHQHLPVAVHARADADGGAGQRFGNLFAQSGGHAFHQHHRRAGLLVRQRIVQQCLRRHIALALHLIAAEHMHRLRREPDVRAHRNAAQL